MYSKYLERVLVVATLDTAESFGQHLVEQLSKLGYERRQTNSWVHVADEIDKFEPHLIFAWWQADSDGDDLRSMARSIAVPVVAVADSGPGLSAVADFCTKMSPPNQLHGFLANPVEEMVLKGMLHTAASYNWRLAASHAIIESYRQ